MKNKILKIFVIMTLAANVSYAKSNTKIDKATFQEIDASYSKDKNGVYVWENRGWKKLEGLDPVTFQIINISGSARRYLKDKNGSQKNYNRTLNYLGDFPLIVLTNKNSASASEIVTGALKDYKRATIIGDKTFGKGIVQQVIPLPATNDAIKLTIAQYFTPKGNYIHEKGIEPDIKIEMEELLTLKGYTNESDQAKKNREKEIEEIIKKDKGDAEAKKIISAGDVQLKRAIQEMNKKIKK